MKKVLSFLGVDEPGPDVWAKVAQAGPPLSHNKDRGPMPAEARRLLLDFYRPHNVRLASLTGNTKFLDWNKD